MQGKLDTLLEKKKILFKSPFKYFISIIKKKNNAAENYKEATGIRGPGTFDSIKKSGEWVAVGKVG